MALIGTNLAISPPDGLPIGTNNLANSNAPSNGSTYSLNADSFPDWSGELLPTSLAIVGSGSPVSFPSLVFKEEQTNALAIHTYPNLDSGRVENMGRNPARFHVRAILTNNIFPAVYEVWKPGSLFPTVFGNLVNLLLNTTTDKIFNHPIYGQITVQVEHWTYELNPKGPRDGAIVEMVLIETIPTSSPPTALLVPASASGLNQTANSLDNAIASTPQSLSPPGMSLSQFFGTISSTIQSVLSTPQSVIAALNTNIFLPITNGIASIGGAFVNAPANTVNNTEAIIQQTKFSIANSPLQASLVNFSTTFNLQNRFNTNYDQSTYNATQAIVALNNTPSQNAFQLMDKIMTAVVALQQHYINQNSSLAAPIIEALRQFLLQVQQTQSVLSTNTNNQAVKVATYVTSTNMSWIALSSYLNNSIDELMGLNQGLINDFWIPAFTTVSYYQSI